MSIIPFKNLNMLSYKVIKKVKPVECKPTKINLKEALSTKKVHNYYFDLEKILFCQNINISISMKNKFILKHNLISS